MNRDALHAKLGHFVLRFQAVEAAMVELTVQVVDADPEYIASLTAELEFNSKARALDVIFTRYAQIHGLSSQAPHSEFHKLMSRIQKLATRRNDLVHSFYHLLITVDGQVGLARTPTRLKPSEGLREQEGEDILPTRLAEEITEMESILEELEKYRLQAIDIRYPDKRVLTGPSTRTHKCVRSLRSHLACAPVKSDVGHINHDVR